MNPAVLLSDNDRFHCIKTDYADRALTRALRDDHITPDDAILISAFIAERKITNAISIRRAQKITSNLITLRRFIKPYRENTIPDIYRGIDKLNSALSARGIPFSQNSRVDLIHLCKQFFLWLIENEEISLSEKKIRAIKLPRKVSTKKASDLLTNDDLQALLTACMTSRDRAMIITMYEGGFRVGEIGEMRWGALKFDGTGVIVNVTFKTGKPRYIRLVMAKEHLIKWKSDYPEEITDEAFVFLNERRHPLTYPAVARQLGRLCQRSGITKHITPHIFRHSRITHLIQQGVGESIIKLMMWGSVDSRMFISYAHLTGADIDREICKLYGIEPTTSQVTGDALEPKVCPHCREMNSPISRHCHICGHGLDQAAIESDDEFMKYANANPELIYNFLKKYGKE